MNEDSCLNFNSLQNMDKSTSNDTRLYHTNEESNNFYYKFLNDKKELDSSPYHSYVKEINKLTNRIDVLTKERNGLKQQCRAAIQQWEKTMRENNQTKDELLQIRQQRDEALKKINHEISQRLKTAKDCTRLTEERNNALQECNLIMSERESVHKEMEKLNEELIQYQKKIKSLDLERKNLIESIEMLKGEIKSNQHNSKSIDKDYLIKQMHKEKYSNNDSLNSFQYGLKSINSNTTNKWGSSSSGFSSAGWTQYGNFKNPLSNSSTNSNVNSAQLFTDTINANSSKQKQQQQLPFSFSNASSVSSTMGNKSKSELSDNELELRKQIQSLEFEYNKYYNKLNFELEQCMNQNEKVMQERESIKTLCDKLRRERDRAVRDRAEAMQDLNDFKLKIESNAQIKKYMDDLNDMNSLSDQTKKQTNASCSKDSAISADMQDEFEHLNIHLINNFRHYNNFKNNAWGFTVQRSQQEKNLIITGINLDSPAEDKLKLNDVILKVNSINLNDDEQLCNELLGKFDKELQLIIQRKKQLSSILNINLDCCKNEHGIVLENVFLIKKILTNSVASKCDSLSAGDRILSINNNSLDSSSVHDVMRLLREDNLLLKIYKQSLNKLSLIVLNNNHDEQLQSSGKLNAKPAYQKDDLHLNSKPNSYSPNIGHYQSIKRSSKKLKVLLNDSSSSFGQMDSKFNDKFSPTLLDKAYNKLFKKSIKSKSEKKEEKKKSSPEKETLDDFNKILNNLSEGDTRKKLFSSSKDKNKNGGTWPSCKSNNIVNTNTNLLSPTYGKVNPLSSTTTYSKKKERKSLAIFANYSNTKTESKEDHLDEQDKLFNYKNYADNYQQYGIAQLSSNKSILNSRTNTPLLESSFKSLTHNHHHNHNQNQKPNERSSLSSSISSYSSKDNYYKSATTTNKNSKKYTLNHDVIYKSFNAPSNSSIQMEQDNYQLKKSKEKKFLADYMKVTNLDKQNKMLDHYSLESSSTANPHHLADFQNDKKDVLRNLNSSLGFCSITQTNKRQLITSNLSNYTPDLESYYHNSGEQGELFLSGKTKIDYCFFDYCF